MPYTKLVDLQDRLSKLCVVKERLVKLLEKELSVMRILHVLQFLLPHWAIVQSVGANIWSFRTSTTFTLHGLKKMQKNIGVPCERRLKYFKSRWRYSIFLIHFSIRKKWHILCLRVPILQAKQVNLIRSSPTYLRCIADRTRSKYDQVTLTGFVWYFICRVVLQKLMSSTWFLLFCHIE